VPKRGDAVHIQPDKWYAFNFAQEICCDCGLVHNVTRKWIGSTLMVKWSRNEKATAAERKRSGVLVVQIPKQRR
jgi:hypothetical protein